MRNVAKMCEHRNDVNAWCTRGDVTLCYYAGCMAHVVRPSHIEQEGRVLNSPAGRVRTDDAADAQAHANLQKTRTMNTTTLFLLLI